MKKFDKFYLKIEDSIIQKTSDVLLGRFLLLCTYTVHDEKTERNYLVTDNYKPIYKRNIPIILQISNRMAKANIETLIELGLIKEDHVVKRYYIDTILQPTKNLKTYYFDKESVREIYYEAVLKGSAHSRFLGTLVQLSNHICYSPREYGRDFFAVLKKGEKIYQKDLADNINVTENTIINRIKEMNKLGRKVFGNNIFAKHRIDDRYEILTMRKDWNK